MKLDPESVMYLCPMCKKLMDAHHNYEVTLASGLVLGPVCSPDCAHGLFLAYQSYWRAVAGTEEIKC